MLSLIGLLGGLALLIVLVMRGMSLFVATPLCALLVALTSATANKRFIAHYRGRRPGS